MKISIIIPVYNDEMFLEQCIQSAILQNIDDKEIICVNDGSTDNSENILKMFCNQYDYIKYFNQHNRGAGAARNLGMQHAQGEFITFLDSDDFYLDRDALEKMFNISQEKKIDICGGFRKNFINGNLIEFELYRDVCINKPKGTLLKVQDFQEDCHFISHIFRRKFLEENLIQFPEYRTYEDPPFFLKTLTIAQKIWVCPVELYCVRRGHQNPEKDNQFIKHRLYGIKDSMKLACRYNFKQLQDKLIDRINYLSFDAIAQYLDFDIVKQLIEIESMEKDTSNRIDVFHQISQCYKSFKFYRNMLCVKQNNVLISDSFIKEDIYAISIYGLGTIGELFYKEIINSEVKIEYCIDREKKEFYGLEVISNLDNIRKCDAIVITPIEFKNILIDLTEKTNIRIIVLTKWIERIYEKISTSIISN